MLPTSHLESRLITFNKINNCFASLINLEMWQPFVHLKKKNLVLFMFRKVEKILVYKKIISVPTHH